MASIAAALLEGIHLEPCLDDSLVACHPLVVDHTTALVVDHTVALVVVRIDLAFVDLDSLTLVADHIVAALVVGHTEVDHTEVDHTEADRIDLAFAATLVVDHTIAFVVVHIGQASADLDSLTLVAVHTAIALADRIAVTTSVVVHIAPLVVLPLVLLPLVVLHTLVH